MKTSKQGIEMIKQLEGCELIPYYCKAGVLTVGYGHTGKDVKKGQAITIEQAEKILVKDLERFEKKVMKYDSKYHFNQNQFDALVSFAYNIGSIDQLCNNGKRTIEEIESKIPLYCKVNGFRNPAIYNRRMKELSLFKKPIVDSNKKGTVIAPSGLNLRSTSSENGKKLTAIPYGYDVEIIKQLSNGWIEVNYNGFHGYVYGKWVHCNARMG